MIFWVTEFRSLAHRALDFEKRDDLSNYEFDVVSFATDVFQLGAKGERFTAVAWTVTVVSVEAPVECRHAAFSHYI